ncbi:ABC transporter permease [Lichenihabitans psoromatis]|uniref:ABC transporter permease n=1 Tax=Lichenihabitans psoromatis TaxID=2528642 RepID=UPI0010384BD5|nr:MlaE family lipid ABC transporter permease subunit [Lichenihabitans psoromatis]
MGSLPQPGGLRWSVRPDGTAAAVADGAWTVAHIATLDTLIEAAGGAPGTGSIALDLQGVSAMDTFGACLLDGLIGAARTAGRTVAVSGPPMRYQALLDAVAHADAWRPVPPPKRRPLASVEALGRGVSGIGNAILVFLAMLGAVGAAAARVVVHPRRFRFTSMVHQLDRVGFQAIPIIVLITLLIGAIIAQQGIFNFRKFGAESYVVDLVGILVLRELGVLVVAIMVAGRSGSSYTAELGSMKMREEIDALRTMGLDPVEVLILPRVIALILALPILAFIGSMAALVGGGLVAWFYGGTNPIVFLAQLRDAVSVTHLEVGLLKAPFMALVIGIVACAEGLRVQGSAESLGLRTTASVVESIFLVIVLDGVFAMIFAAIGM